MLESEPTRASTVVRIPGVDPAAPALLVHGHLDVVPANAADWSFDPFCGEVRDGAVWGRGALDMKDMDAMMLAVVRGWARSGFRPPRDIVLAFVADEEDTGEYGAGFLVNKHPELFEGVQTAIGESGGYAVHLPNGGRLYPVATGERGSAWMRLTAHGAAGHGSRKNSRQRRGIACCRSDAAGLASVAGACYADGRSLARRAVGVPRGRD